MSAEPPARAKRVEEGHERRGAEHAFIDVVAEVRFAPEEVAQVAVVLDALRPVVREEDRRLGELYDARAKCGALVLEDVYKLEERHTRKSLRTLYSRMWYILRIEP